MKDSVISLNDALVLLKHDVSPSLCVVQMDFLECLNLHGFDYAYKKFSNFDIFNEQ